MNIGRATSPIAPTSPIVPIAPSIAPASSPVRPTGEGAEEEEEEEAMVVAEEVEEAEEAGDGGAAVGERGVKSTTIAVLCGVLGAVRRRTLPPAAADPAFAAGGSSFMATPGPAVDDDGVDGDVDGAVDVGVICKAVGCAEGSVKLSVLGAEEAFDERFVAPVRRPPRPRPRLPSIVRRERGWRRDREPALLPPPPVPPPKPPPRPRLPFWSWCARCAGREAPRPASETTRSTTAPEDATRSMTSLRVLAAAEEEEDDEEEEEARSELEGEAAAAAVARRELCSRWMSFCRSNDVMEARARMEEGDRDARTHPAVRSSCVEGGGACCSTLTAPRSILWFPALRFEYSFD